MELVYTERRNGFHDEGATPEFSGRSDEEHRHPPITASEHQIGCTQGLPLEGKKIRSCQSCQNSLCSCSGEAPHSDDYLTLPVKMMILQFLIRSLRHPRRTHNVSDLDELVNDGTRMGSRTLGPSEKLIMDSRHELENARTKPKSPSFFLSGAKVRKIRSRSHILTQTEILKLMSPEMCDTSSPGASTLKRKISEFNIHEKMLPSYSNSASMSSNQSASSSFPSLSAGLLHCIWKDGLPHFEFSLDNPIGVYTANPIEVYSDNDKALDYVYLFHSGEQGRKDWISNSSNASKFIGKMKVSSSLALSSDKSSLMETEFVLFGAHDDYMKQMQTSSSVPKGKGLAKRVAEMMRPGNFSSSPKHGWKFGKSCSQQFDDTKEILGELSSAKESGLTNHLTNDLPTNHELAAIVAREERHEHQKEPVVGGWGLKFLEKAGAEYSVSTEDSRVQNRKETTRCITVVVPSGYHGGAIVQDGGPSSLIERWRSGGCCDCGGWDLGCPIRVLDNGCGSLSEAVSQDCKSVDLLIKGAKNNEPILRLVNIADDLYILYFDSSLLPLQCFSTGVAIIHSQASHLYPKL